MIFHDQPRHPASRPYRSYRGQAIPHYNDSTFNRCFLACCAACFCHEHLSEINPCTNPDIIHLFEWMRWFDSGRRN